ncbi:polysaccharide pyruvyl transferase family protein [Brachybacterium sp. DNPG3]
MKELNDYNSRLRRRLRTVRRLVGYQVTPQLYPRCVAPRTWWWSRESNFGDALTPFILPKYGVAPILKPEETAELFAVGSILSEIPEEYEGVIWGTGSFGDETDLPTDAKILAVRGRLTWRNLGEPEVLSFGDPGLLMRNLVKPSAKKWEVGLIPHVSHRGLPVIQKLAALDGVKFIDVARSPRRVARDISSCEHIVTTSLHGLILADSYRIPAAWAMQEPVILGAEFKFLDHESVVLPEEDRWIELSGNETLKDLIARTVLSDADAVQACIDGLESSISQLKRDLGGSVSPWALWGMQLKV